MLDCIEQQIAEHPFEQLGIGMEKALALADQSNTMLYSQRFEITIGGCQFSPTVQA
ncbi:hypothetical protein [Methylomonas methanica]|uniref:hypothetical protein n=1 Tax=Methylomonas methanica TaxID=421 RepID=UPI001E651123|nr:hypothetical protein [Methylomonas methanica]